MAPQVQSLADVLAQLNPAYSAQEDIIKQQQAGLGAKYGAQKTGLEAAKVKGFNTINTQANARGLAFSGIPLEEQANYLAEKYLPGLQQLDYQQNEENIGLQKQLAGIGTEKTTRALSTIEQQKQDLNSWNQMLQQQAFQAQQAEKERAFTASQNAAATSEDTTTFEDELQDTLANMVSQEGWADTGATERVIQSMATRWGKSPSEVAKIVYPWRKQLIGR